MYKTVLIPIDPAHSGKGEAMINVARSIGGDDAEILLLSVVEGVPSYIAAQIPRDVIDKSKENAALVLEGMAKSAGLKARAEVRLGQSYPVILGVADEIGADLIIVASHRPGLQDYFLGSTAARVVRHANCSVLVVR
jgi:nucleotide-binding universal stress UspA family protein